MHLNFGGVLLTNVWERKRFLYQLSNELSISVWSSSAKFAVGCGISGGIELCVQNLKTG